uniref:Si:dkey-243k1.3 n=1 Tax=Hucho hucho TaxID=62062 RepID=A0A4W5M406_9TELE
LHVLGLSLCVLLAGTLSLVEGDVVANFEDIPECVEYFYQGKVLGWGVAIPGAARLCQRFYNRYHFATLYDTNHRIAVYSAYRFQPSNGGGREKSWFVEPQLVNLTWGAEMKDGYWLGKDHPRVYLGERLHPLWLRPHCNATFTLTNVVPQNPKLNQNAWVRHESQLTDLFNAQCAQTYVLVGTIPSTDNWIVKDNVRRINIPEYIWNAYCCVDNNAEPVRSGGATALNTEQNRVDQHSLLELNGFLQQYSNAPIGELFHNNCQAVHEE